MAAGKLFETVFGFDYELAVTVVTLFVVSYTLFGGFLAVSWTELVQGLLMAAALLLAPVIAVRADGGIGPLGSTLNERNPELLTLWRDNTGETLSLIAIVVASLATAAPAPAVSGGFDRYRAGLMQTRTAKRARRSPRDLRRAEGSAPRAAVRRGACLLRRRDSATIPRRRPPAPEHRSGSGWCKEARQSTACRQRGVGLRASARPTERRPELGAHHPGLAHRRLPGIRG